MCAQDSQGRHIILLELLIQHKPRESILRTALNPALHRSYARVQLYLHSLNPASGKPWRSLSMLLYTYQWIPRYLQTQTISKSFTVLGYSQGHQFSRAPLKENFACLCSA